MGGGGGGGGGSWEISWEVNKGPIWVSIDKINRIFVGVMEGKEKSKK